MIYWTAIHHYMQKFSKDLLIVSDSPMNRAISVAPMLDWTDKHCRYFLRQISKHAILYTEMVTTGAIIFGKGDYLEYNQEEHPVALQLGGEEGCLHSTQ